MDSLAPWVLYSYTSVPYEPRPIPPKEIFEQNNVKAINLNVGEKVEIESGELNSWTFADSRCPQGVRCVWAGEVEIGLKYRNNSTLVSQDLTLRLPGNPIVVDGYEIGIIAVSPEKAAEPIVKNSYRILIAVRRVEEVVEIPPSGNPLKKGFGTVSGIVLMGPMCPVMREGVECPDRGAPDVALLITDIKGGYSYTVTTDSSGSFSIPVQEGTYIIRNASTKPYPIVSPSGDVMVTPGINTWVPLHGDSGIR